ncbi:DUF305 domain-containing protein [Nocardiopsis lambiniae]|uniref:DUF305 domain-containing protein n=1 Tax=Nocardiopsis lambiniae TaxID=3075539 RepID=A0ABU2M5B5_9ACTN|nr:DUF305 domain-containing protein [Nocardiopsis sp. DSM 44743]MDT0327827.1 DUF305 domain-containing protein [Nocardiopsis sp. DSM 44743]
MEHKSGTGHEAADDVDGVDDLPDAEREEDLRAGFTEEAEPRVASLRSTPIWLTVILVAVALGLGYLLGRPSYPLDTGADAGFLRDMSVHHNQAVDMSMIVLDKTDDAELRVIATDMARTQQAQVGMMQGWLRAWDLPIRGPEAPMSWMAGSGHEHGGEGEAPETMPGLATSEQIVDLEEAEGVEAEVLFLELMIAHHLGGIEMAEVEVELGREEMVVGFAQGMINAQTTEVELMEGMLEDRAG